MSPIEVSPVLSITGMGVGVTSGVGVGVTSGVGVGVTSGVGVGVAVEAERRDGELAEAALVGGVGAVRLGRAHFKALE